MMKWSEVERLEELLSDDKFDSKDWRSGGIVERVEWLLAMYKSKSEECDMGWGWLDKETDEAERAEREYHKVAMDAAEEWDQNGLETICDRDSFITKRLKDAGYE